MRFRSLLLYLLIAVFVIILDQVSKSIIQLYLFEGEKVSVIGDLLYFRLVYNSGGAMGTRIGPSWIYLILTIVALAIIVRYFLTTPHAHWHIKTALAMIFGGAVGNLIDRVLYGRVIDFIDMDFPDIAFLYIRRWFTYNIADAAITIGLIIFAVSILFGKKDKAVPEEIGNSSELLENNGDQSYS
jgi:signal peptidase II